MGERSYTTMWEFKTANFTVRAGIMNDYDLDLSWDYDGEVMDKWSAVKGDKLARHAWEELAWQHAVIDAAGLVERMARQKLDEEFA